MARFRASTLERRSAAAKRQGSYDSALRLGRRSGGSIALEPHAAAADLATVNGSVHLQEGAQVKGRVRTWMAG